MRHKQEDHRHQDQGDEEVEEEVEDLSIRAGTDSTTERKQKVKITKTRNQRPPDQKLKRAK